MEDPDKKPKKSKKSPRKQSPKKAAKKSAKKVSPTPPPLPDMTTVPSLSTITALLRSHEDPSLARKRKSISAVGHQLQEHLGSYIVIGYTIDGEPVQLTYAPTYQDMDALSTSLQRFIITNGGL